MLVGRREFAIGPHAVTMGSEVTREMQEMLPAGRLTRMINLGWIEDLDNQLDVGTRLASLEESVANLTTMVERLLPTKVTSNKG